jgi:hypothetical protein
MTALLFSACANRATFEWIKINPDKIKEANTRVAYRNGIRNVDLTLDLKEKTIPIYYESPEAFEAGNSTPIVLSKPGIVSKPKVKSKVIIHPAVALKKEIITKPIPKKPLVLSKPDAPKVKKVADSVIPDEERIALDKLNGAMRIPKKPIIQIIGEQKETPQPVKKEIKKALITNQKTILSKTVAKPNATVEQKVIQTEVKPTAQKQDKVKEFLNARKGNNFILAGAALAVIGVVLGLIFGKSAYLVSGAGIIFAAIGFVLKL